MWSIIQRKIGGEERQKAAQYIRKLCDLIDTFDRDAEEYNRVFDGFELAGSSTSADREALWTAAEKSQGVASEVSCAHSKLENVPPCAGPTFNAWAIAFEEYVAFSIHRALNAGFLAKHGQAPMDQTLHLRHYHKFNRALSAAQRKLRKLARRLGIGEQELAEWLKGGQGN